MPPDFGLFESKIPLLSGSLKAWLVIPVVFFHGKQPWKGKKSFHEGFWGKNFAEMPVSVRKDLLNYGMRLLDTQDPKVSAVLKDKNFKSRGFLNALKRVWDLKADEVLLNKAVSLFDNWPGDRDELLLSLGAYFWAAVPGMTEQLWRKVESSAVKRGIFSKGGYMNIKEYIREEGRQEGMRQGVQQGMKQGVQQGMQQGMQARNREIVLNMLKSRLDTSLICKVTGLSKKEINKLKNGKSERSDKGFSLMEILIALALVVGVSAALFNNFSQSRDKGQVSQAKIMISRLVDAFNTFYMDCNYYPSTSEGLEALVIAPEKCESWGPEPYLKNGKIPKDPWKNDFVYEYDEASGSFEVISFGKGGKKGGEKPPHPTADISSKDL